ncbi:MAG TPA: HEAT repeat domain-containing protein [Planctomycetota bacterium]|nr:HEAT repeat domain-containing protein [Planctomycetota bacterium]
MRASAAIFLLLLLCGSGPARADRLELKGGGELEGDVLREGESYRVRLPTGGEVVLDACEVARVTPGSTWRDEYIRRLNTVDRTDAEALYRLALFCQDHALKQEAQVLLLEAVEVVPNHEGARAALGEVYFDGEWVPRDEAQRRRGQVQFRGRWVSPEEQRTLEWKERTHAYVLELRRLSQRLRSTDEATRAKAARDLAAIDDPAAIDGLLELSSYYVPEVRAASARGLARLALEEPAAVDRLARLACRDEEVAVQDAAVAAVAGAHLAPVADAILRTYVSADEAWVRNAAAHALGRIRWKAAFGPLVRTLTFTVLRQRLVPAGPAGGPLMLGTHRISGYRGSVDRDYHLEPYAYRVVEDIAFNDAARAALKDLCGEDHDFDRPGWLVFWSSKAAGLDDCMRPLPPPGLGADTTPAK